VNAPNNALPSATALMSATARAAHEEVDSPPHLLSDSDARAVCSLFEPSPLDFQRKFPNEPVLAAARVSAVIRASFAWAALRAGGLDQCVLLGAGLDTSVYRGTEEQSRVWLVDRPGVLAWRASLFAQAHLDDEAVAVPIDLADDPLPALADAGLDLARGALVVALGLSMCLEPSQNRTLLARMAGLAPGSELVFDAMLPVEETDSVGGAYAAAVSASAGRSGEPWRSRPSLEMLTGWLAGTGWQLAGRVDEAEAAPTQFWAANPQLRPMRLVRLIRLCRR